MIVLRLMGQAETVRHHPSPHKCRLVSWPPTVHSDALMERVLFAILRLLFALKLAPLLIAIVTDPQKPLYPWTFTARRIAMPALSFQMPSREYVQIKGIWLNVLSLL